MIFGVGTDLIEIERVKKAFQKKSFAKKYFTENEISLCEKRAARPAVQFAGKEAVVKAFGTGFGKIIPSEIEILRGESGVPFVVLHGEAKRYAEEHQISKIHISLSDDKTTAMAFVVAEQDEIKEDHHADGMVRVCDRCERGKGS